MTTNNKWNLPSEIEIGLVDDGDGTRWITWSDGDSYVIPGTWSRDNSISAGLAGVKAIEAGQLAPGGMVKVIDVGYGKGPRHG